MPAVDASPAGAASSAAEPPDGAAASNAVVRTVTICQNITLFNFTNRSDVLTIHSDGIDIFNRWLLYLNWVQGLEGHDGIASIHSPDKSLAMLH